MAALSRGCKPRNILFSAKKIEYINKTHAQSGAKKSLFQFCLTITEPFSPIYLEDMKNDLSLVIFTHG